MDDLRDRASSSPLPRHPETEGELIRGEQSGSAQLPEQKVTKLLYRPEELLRPAGATSKTDTERFPNPWGFISHVHLGA